MEPLRQLGIDVTEATIRMEAMRQGINKNNNEMTYAEKSQLRYLAILRQTTSAQGDFARTMDSPANQLKILREQFALLSREIGNIFIPILNKILPYVIAVVMVLQDMARAIANFFGFKLPKVDYSSIKTGASDVAGAYDDVADSVGNATKKTKEFQKQLLGVDELNVIQPPSSSASGGGGTGAGATGGSGFDLDLPSYDNLMDSVTNKAKELKKQVEPLVKVIMGLVGALGLLKLAVGLVKLISFINEIKKFIKTGETASATVTVLGNAIKFLSSVFSGIGKVISFIVEMIGKLAPAIMIVTGIIAFFKGLIDILDKAKPYLQGFLEAIAGIALVIGGALLAGVSTTVAIIIGIVGAIGVLIATIVRYWDEIVAFISGLEKWLGEAFESVKEGVINAWNGIIDFISGLPEWFSEKISEIVKFFEELPERLGYALGYALGTIIKWCSDVWNTVSTEVPKIISNIVDFFGELAGNIWDAIVVFITKTLPDWVNQSIKFVTVEVPKIISKIVSLFGQLASKIFNEIIKFCTQTIPNWVSTGVNTVAREVPKIINKVVDFFKQLPDKIMQAINQLWDKFVNIGKRIKDGIFEGLNGIGKSISKFASGFVNGIKDALGIHSPARKLIPVGVYSVMGIEEGWDKEQGTMIKKASDFSKKLQDTISPSAGYSINYENIPMVNSNMKNISVPTTSSSTLDITSNITESLAGIINSQDRQAKGVYIDKDILVGVIKDTLNNDTGNFGSNQFDFRIG